MAVKGNKLTPRCREAEVAEKVRSVPLWSVTTWDKKFNTVTKDKQKKVIKYHYFLASELEPIVEIGGTVKILTTYESDLWTAESKVQGCVSEGEIVSIPWGGNPNVQYFKGRFVTADNRIATSSDTSILSNRYLFYFMLAKKDLIGSFYRGASLKHPEMSKVLDMKIPLPPLPAQRRIAAELDKICELKKNAETRLEKLDLLVKSRFVEMFGGPKLTDMLHPLVPIGELFNVGSSKRVFQKDWRSEGVPFYRAREVVKLSRDGHVDNELFISEEMFADYARQYGLPKPNDILVTGVGTLGVCYVVQKGDRFYYKDGNIICLNSKGLIDSTFVYHCYQQQFVRDQIDKNALGSTVGTYTIDSARKMLVPLPPPALQREFAAFVEKVDKLRENMRATVAKMDMLYRSKLQEYFG